MSAYLVGLLWAVVGAAGGWLVRWGSVKLARLEGLEPGSRWWQVYGPPVLSGVVFAVYGYEITSLPLLLVRSIFVLVLIQVIFFDFEHHLILDRVMFPAMLLAFLVTLSPLISSRIGLWQQPWYAGIGMGVAAGLLFLLLGLAGSALFRAEALGFGDVHRAVLRRLAGHRRRDRVHRDAPFDEGHDRLWTLPGGWGAVRPSATALSLSHGQ